MWNRRLALLAIGPISVIALLANATACGGAGAAIHDADGLPTDHPLHGAWVTHVGNRGDSLPCPFVLELFSDGTAELNYLSDDSDAKACQFARVPYTHDPAAEPPRISLAGQLSRCIYRRDGELLRLSCEDHADYPTDLESALVLRPLSVRTGGGLSAMVGRWSAVGFWGSGGGLHISIRADGSLRAGEVEGRIEVHDSHRLTMGLGEHEQLCRYRVTERRLTLRCEHPSRGFPESFSGPGAPTSTVVLSRPGPGADGPSPVGSDRDGDGIDDGSDTCPDDIEDYDEFEDEDGCPDVDNDQDGVPDAEDSCPNRPEDMDGSRDADGCPDP